MSDDMGSFFSAIRDRDLQSIKTMLDGNIDVNIPGDIDDTPLGYAISCNDIEIIRLLIEYGANPNLIGEDSETPLHWAISSVSDRIDIVRLLLESGANPNIMSDFFGTPFHCAVEADQIEIARLLLSYGADINASNEDKDCSTPLHHAKPTEMTVFLLDNGAKVDAQDSWGQTPLHMAAENGKPDICRVLIDYGADVNAQDSYRDTPLHKASTNMRSTLINLGMSNDTPASWEDFLQEGTPQDRLEVCNLLIANGASIDARDCRGWSPLHEAVWEEQAEIVELLLAEGVYIDSRTGYFSEYWLTPLKDIGGVQLKNGWTPLHVAVKKNSTLMIQLLIDKGADINSKLSDLGTPLHWAEELHNEEAAELLRKHGALL